MALLTLKIIVFFRW